MLQISNLNKTYEKHQALKDVSLEVPEGVIFGLLGPNGAGKTTLIRIINQIIEQDSGSVELDGKLLTPDDIRKIGYLPEERGLYKKMKVWDQLIYFARLKGLSQSDAQEKVKLWLQKLDILSWRDKKIEDLSKGMAQKVQFISTVIHQPKLLILDEPFSGFDPVNAEIIKNEILELKESGTTVILSTHRMESVELLCDQIAMIHKSRKILDGSIQEIKSQFRSNQYLVSLTNLNQTLPENWNVTEKGSWVEFSLALEGKSSNDLLIELMQYGQVVGFRELVPSMEEIFIQQVKATGHE
ncbi:ABC transporter ATP-binding protein [Algoriphagus sanaruensis]|uniref:ABC transporter ATP-binding protein n=1 Tax=Algoriphagus sanaruensis TaxID=1727163 RepID=A0A142EIE4_9BACT|nr:ATP-binding cassette domain-containing protein [Algoriphagus sanaruensis]AMQ54899.1 ABC transporter ATP-binding protein [Algoriphagus sanaruensis]